MSKHTPGPWFILGAPSEINAEKPYDICAGGFSALIATTCPLRSADHKRYEGLANARLIAAAPELLAALTRLLSPEMIRDWPYRDEDIEYARAAIAKASGE